VVRLVVGEEPAQGGDHAGGSCRLVAGGEIADELLQPLRRIHKILGEVGTTDERPVGVALVAGVA